MENLSASPRFEAEADEIYLTCRVFYSDDWFYSGLIRKWRLCDYSVYAGICVSIATLLLNILRISCPILIKSDRWEDIKLLSSYKWLNRGKRCCLSTISNPTEEKAQAWAHPSTGITASQQRDFEIKTHQASLVLMLIGWLGSPLLPPCPNTWKLAVGCFLLCLNNIHLQARWHIRHYISLHDCHYNLEGQIVARSGWMHKWRKVVCATLPVCPLLQRGGKTAFIWSCKAAHC